MKNTMKTMTTIELLEREIGAQHNAVRSAIANRRDHPTYGYTKKDLLERYNQLVGMLYAHRVMTTDSSSAAVWLFAADGGVVLDIDLNKLREQVKAA